MNFHNMQCSYQKMYIVITCTAMSDLVALYSLKVYLHAALMHNSYYKYTKN